MRETIEKLKGSVLFNLSLSSKELFHSNFLYWIGQNYPKEFGALFVDYLNKKPSDSKIINISREKENIDLSFKYSNNQEILIENKVKSVPYLSQLSKYSKKHTPDRNYILLSLSEPLFFNSEKTIVIDNVTWHFLSYSELRNRLQTIVTKIDIDYHKNIISDYLTFIDGLVEANQLCQIKEDDLFDFHSLEANPIYKSLMDIRLHDFYLKKKYEFLAYEVYKRVTKLSDNVNGFSQPLKWDSNPSLIYTAFGMTNAQGLMDIKYVISKNVALGIQIQGPHYRMFIEDSNGKIAHKNKEELGKELWFNFDRSFPNERIYPKTEKGFNKYGETFFYKSAKLGIHRKVSDVLDIVLADFNHIHNNLKRFQEIFDFNEGLN